MAEFYLVPVEGVAQCYRIVGLTKMRAEPQLYFENEQWKVSVRGVLGRQTPLSFSSMLEAICFFKALEGAEQSFISSNTDFSLFIDELGARFSLYQEEMSREHMHLCLYREGPGAHRTCSFVVVDESGRKHFHHVSANDLITKSFPQLCTEARVALGTDKQLINEDEIPLSLTDSFDKEKLFAAADDIHTFFFDAALRGLSDEPLIFNVPSSGLRCIDQSSVDGMLRINQQYRDTFALFDADRTGIHYLLTHLEDEEGRDNQLLHGLNEKLAKGVFTKWAASFSTADYERLDSELARGRFIQAHRDIIQNLTQNLERFIQRGDFPEEIQALMRQRSEAESLDERLLIEAQLLSLTGERLVSDIRDNFFTSMLQAVELQQVDTPQWLQLFESLSNEEQLDLVGEVFSYHFELEETPILTRKATEETFVTVMAQLYDALFNKQEEERSSCEGRLVAQYDISGEACTEETAFMLSPTQFREPMTMRTLDTDDAIDGRVYQQLLMAALSQAVDGDHSRLPEDIADFISERLEGDADYINQGSRNLAAFLYNGETFNFTPPMLDKLAVYGITPVARAYEHRAQVGASAASTHVGFFARDTTSTQREGDKDPSLRRGGSAKRN